MAEIDGGALSFKSVMDNAQLDTAIEETLRRVQGFSDAVVASGGSIDTMVADVRDALSQIGAACEIHENAISGLQAEYDQLGLAATKALQTGNDKEYGAIQDRRNAIQGEIRVREQLLKELREQSNALEDEATKMEQSAQQVANNANQSTMLRTRIRNLKEEMAALIADGIDEQSEAYKRLVNELGRLQDIQGDIATQGKIMSNDENQFAGMLSGLQGVVGGFTAAQGAVALFAGESENLQKIMLKVQSLMSITMGLQQAAQALNKDSAFQLVTINGLKEWWNNLLAIGRGEQEAATAATVADTAATAADTAATAANTVAQQANTGATGANTVAQGANTVATGAQTTAAVAGTAANISLAGAFRMVGAAIKSIPVFGWIAAAIGALIAVIGSFAGKAREAKKAQEEWYKSVANNAYKPIGAITQLQSKWNALGDDLDAKKQFINENHKAFDELGVSIQGVTDAENLLTTNKEAFIQAQIEKAKSMVYIAQAEEKVKALIKAQQEYNAMPDKVTQFSGGGMFGGGISYETDNLAKEKKKAEIDALTTEIEQGYQNAANAETNGLKKLEQAGIDATNQYIDGSLGAIEQAISVKTSALKNLTNNADYEAALKEIQALQKQADAITGAKKSGGDTSKDPFLDKLNKYKAEYQRFTKWINSGDAVLVQSANQEFASLLAEGATYIDYLKKQRDTILSVDVANRTKEQNAQLKTLNDTIAEETKKTVLESFNEELSASLTNARSVMEMLNIIEERRKQLANDGTETDTAKGEALDNAEKDVMEQMKQQTASLLEDYAGYAAQRLAIDEKYYQDMELLNKARLAAQTDDERQAIDDAIANRKRQYETDTKGSGYADYDSMLAEYGSFEQRKQAIVDEYEEKRRIAMEQGNTEMIARLNEAQAKAISALATSDLTSSDIWGQLFNNLDELTASEIETLVTEIESRFDELSGVFNPIDLQSVREKLNQAKLVLIQDNPFKQMGQALKAIFNDAGDDSKDSADKIKKNWKKLGESTEASFQFVMDAVNSCDFLKDAIGDVGATAISSMTTVAATSIAVATAIKTAEKSSVILAIIQAALVVVQAVVNVVKSIVGNNDGKLEKQIGKWKGSVDELKNSYAQLSWEIDRALGGSVYKKQKEAIKNLQEQQQLLRQMEQAEKSKKKTDEDKVADYRAQQAEKERQIQERYEEIAEDILQTNAKSFADDLGDALVEAFSKGEDASKAFEETVNDVLKNAIVNQLKKNFLEKQLQGALKQLKQSMGYWNGDEFIFDGLTDSEIQQFKNKVAAAKNGYMQAMEIYRDLFKDLTEEEDEEDSLTGAVKGVSEETASIVAGQLNAIRVNQLESVDIMRQQLMSLNQIANNTSYNYHLAKLDRVVSLLESMGADGTLRAQGLSD